VRFAWLLLFVASCGKLIDDTDAGDAAIPKDANEASEATTANDGSSDDFPCGEAGQFIYCNSKTQYCRLIKTSKTHDYYCAELPATDCTTPASSKFDCGCFKDGDEIFVTICK